MTDATFFDDENVQDLAEAHVEAIRSLETSEAAAVMKRYKAVRQELRDRLESSNKGSFTAQRMRGVLVQVESALDAMTKNLTNDMSESAAKAAEKGIQNLIKEIKDWNKVFTGAVIPINLNAVAVASDVNNLLFSRYESSLETYNSFVRGAMARSLTESVIKEESMTDVVANLSKTFMGEEWKLQQIVRTELHNVYCQGKLRGMTELWDEGKGDISDLKKTLFHPMDARTGKDSKELAAHNPIVSIDEPFVEYSTGHRLEYMAPPNRPNDRAILIPYRESWTS